MARVNWVFDKKDDFDKGFKLAQEWYSTNRVTHSSYYLENKKEKQ